MPNPADRQPVATDLDLTDSSVQLVQAIAQAADDRKAADMMLLKVGSVSSLADYFLIMTGFSKTQVRAIANAIAANVEETLHRRPLRPAAGVSEGGWVLLDYGDVVVHIQTPQERDYYNLEAFWGHAEQFNVAPLIAHTPAPV
jgi:ribosome-associated protein